MMPAKKEMPSTLQRSPKGAQETWAKAHDSAVDTYGEGERAHRTAFSALKHEYKKVGDRWEQKKQRGPSDNQAKRKSPEARDRPRTTAGGVDANASKQELYETAKKLEIDGRSSMTKSELVKAIDKENDRRTRKSRR
jgi:cation transport regulator ChaB